MKKKLSKGLNFLLQTWGSGGGGGGGDREFSPFGVRVIVKTKL